MGQDIDIDIDFDIVCLDIDSVGRNIDIVGRNMRKQMRMGEQSGTAVVDHRRYILFK